jgi:hypothetical protein
VITHQGRYYKSCCSAICRRFDPLNSPGCRAAKLYEWRGEQRGTSHTLDTRITSRSQQDIPRFPLAVNKGQYGEMTKDLELKTYSIGIGD